MFSETQIIVGIVGIVTCLITLAMALGLIGFVIYLVTRKQA